MKSATYSVITVVTVGAVIITAAYVGTRIWDSFKNDSASTSQPKTSVTHSPLKDRSNTSGSPSSTKVKNSDMVSSNSKHDSAKGTTALGVASAPITNIPTGNSASKTATTSATPSTVAPSPSGRNYTLHTSILATTFWVGEQFQATADGSQVCSAYNSQWQYSFFHLKTGVNNAAGCNGSFTGGCDARVNNANSTCDDTNSVASLRTPANGYFPAGLPAIYENPFYLDLPYDDYNASTSSETTGYSSRCSTIPWANDAGYYGHCTDRNFSYMKNRFVKTTANGQTCYGQIEDAGPADSGNGNGNYADSNYVFGSKNARPFNQSYNSAGMDISPALGACLGGSFNNDLILNWQFIDTVDVPSGAWKTIVTTSAPS